jgi:hypothetical protein
MQLSSSSGAKMTDIKEISPEVVKERVKLYEQAFGVKVREVNDIVINDKVRDIFRYYMDFAFCLKDSDENFDLAIKQFIHAINQPSPRDQFFEPLSFLRIVYEWDIFDMQFEYLSGTCQSEFLDELEKVI